MKFEGVVFQEFKYTKELSIVKKLIIHEQINIVSLVSEILLPHNIQQSFELVALGGSNNYQWAVVGDSVIVN